MNGLLIGILELACVYLWLIQHPVDERPLMTCSYLEARLPGLT